MDNGLQLNFIWQQTGTTANTSGRNPGDIIFLEQSEQLYVNGVYFGLSKEQGQALAKAVEDVQDLTEKVGTESKLSRTLLAVAEELKEKLDGGSYTGAQGMQGPQGLVIAGIQGATPTNVVDAINKLNSFIQSVKETAGVISINEKTGTVILDGSDINIGAQGPQGLQGTSIDAAFAGVQTTLASHQTTLASHQNTLDTLNGSDSTEGSVAKAVKDATLAIKGTKADGDETAETIRGAKDYADEKAGAAQAAAISGAQTYTDQQINALAGENWSENAKTVKNIIDELSDGGNAEFTTFIDKVRGDYTYGNQGHQSVKGYIDEQVAGAITAAGNQGAASIQELDATVRGNLEGNDTISTGKKVGVKVVEENGKLTGVQVVENDIASAAALGDVQTTVNTHATEIAANTAGIQGLQSQLAWTVI